eukprot:366449-Chlamydomonas_euryale.AAC.4
MAFALSPGTNTCTQTSALALTPGLYHLPMACAPSAGTKPCTRPGLPLSCQPTTEKSRPTARAGTSAPGAPPPPPRTCSDRTYRLGAAHESSAASRALPPPFRSASAVLPHASAQRVRRWYPPPYKGPPASRCCRSGGGKVDPPACGRPAIIVASGSLGAPPGGGRSATTVDADTRCAARPPSRTTPARRPWPGQALGSGCARSSTDVHTCSSCDRGGEGRRAVWAGGGAESGTWPLVSCPGCDVDGLTGK